MIPLPIHQPRRAEVSKLTVPLRERRAHGMFRMDYQGRTLRKNLGVPVPASRYMRRPA